MKGFKIYIGIGVLIIVLYVVAQLNKPKPINWESTFSYNDKIPFGTYIVYHELGQIFPGARVEKINKTMAGAFRDTTLNPSNYIIVSKTIDANKADTKALLKFVSNGNSVFMASNNFQGFLTDTLKLSTDYTGFNKKVTGVNFTNPKIKRAEEYRFESSLVNQYFSAFDTVRAVSLASTGEGKSTYLRYKFGKGNLYLFANPYMFTNYGLLQDKDCADFAAKALSYLPKQDFIYWDQYQNHDVGQDISPMRVLLGNEYLRWAYYLSLAALLMFVLYEMKRRQRIIPIINPLKNATLDFVNVVGRVYYEQRDNADIAAKKIKYLFEYLRSNLQFRQGIDDKDFMDLLAQKTGLDQQFIRELTEQIYYTLNQSKITDTELVRLNNLIDKFYAKTK